LRAFFCEFSLNIPPSIRLALGCVVVVLLCLSYLNGTLRLGSALLQFESFTPETISLPEPWVLRAGTLNYGTFAADLGWAAAVVDHGEAKRRGRLSDSLEHNADVVAMTDPMFLPIYSWFSAAYLNNLGKVDPSDVGRVNNFLKRGMAVHPTEFSLPYSAALNYIGYSANLDPNTRLRQVEDAIQLLETSSGLIGADESVPLLLGWFFHRKRQLMKGKANSENTIKQEIDFNLKLLAQSSSPEVREAIQENLKMLGADTGLATKTLIDQQRTLDLALLQSQPYLPLDFWLTLQEEKLQ